MELYQRLFYTLSLGVSVSTNLVEGHLKVSNTHLPDDMKSHIEISNTENIHWLPTEVTWPGHGHQSLSGIDQSSPREGITWPECTVSKKGRSLSILWDMPAPLVWISVLMSQGLRLYYDTVSVCKKLRYYNIFAPLSEWMTASQPRIKARLHCPTIELSWVESYLVLQWSQGYDWSRGHFVRLDHRVVHHEKNKMYNSIVVASPRHKVYDCLVRVSWAVEPGLNPLSHYIFAS